MTQYQVNSHSVSNVYFTRVDWRSSDKLTEYLLESNPLFDPLTDGFVLGEEDYLILKLKDFYGVSWEKLSYNRIPNIHKNNVLWDKFAVRLFKDYYDMYVGN
jgi:hypothetical protein